VRRERCRVQSFPWEHKCFCRHYAVLKTGIVCSRCDLHEVLSALRKSGAQVRANPIENSRFCGQKKSSRSRNFSPRKHLFLTTPSSRIPHLIPNTNKMTAEGASASGTTPRERHAIGISFGNSNSSIAYTTIEDKAEVIANEDGGMLSLGICCSWMASNVGPRPANSFDPVICGRRRI
jgi:hypothetical protein